MRPFVLIAHSMALFCCCHIFANLAFADSALTVGASGGSINPMVELSNAGRGGVAQRITSSDVSVRIRGSCYATNLRGVANPISPNSTLRMSGKMSLNGAASSDFSISIPARIVVGGGLSGAGTQEFGPDWMTGLPSNARLAASGSMVMLKILTADTAKLDPVTATISETKNVFNISDLRFDQIVSAATIIPSNQDYSSYATYAQVRRDSVADYDTYTAMLANQAYTAKDGPVSGTVSMSKSTDGKVIDILASFPGENFFCGGYYSPLMVFFDGARPKFDNVSEFDMGTGFPTHWPEKNHAGYFVALPKNGKIVSKDQLFGEDNEFKNGFAKLAKHDSNRDGVINAKDPIFKKLILWKDKKGLGIFKASDGILLSSKVKAINLNYKLQIEPVGAFAELRERSFFEFKNNKATSLQKGEVIDVWLKPAPRK